MDYLALVSLKSTSLNKYIYLIEEVKFYCNRIKLFSSYSLHRFSLNTCLFSLFFLAFYQKTLIVIF